jgi:hypothetical protein
MLTTLEIPDHILTHAKRRAVEEARSLKDIIAETLSAELAATSPARTAQWRVPVASRDMGWNGLSWEQIRQVQAAELDQTLLHRAALDTPSRHHAQH